MMHSLANTTVGIRTEIAMRLYDYGASRVGGAEEHLDRRIAFRVRTVEVFNSIQTPSSL
jgi:hypothetical protein